MQWSRGSPVVVVKPAEHRHRLGNRGLCDVDSDRRLPRDPLADSLVGSCLVEQHPHIFNEELLVYGERRRANLVVLRCHQLGDEQRDCTHIPLWMFDRTACALMQTKDGLAFRSPSSSKRDGCWLRLNLSAGQPTADLGVAANGSPAHRGQTDREDLARSVRARRGRPCVLT